MITKGEATDENLAQKTGDILDIIRVAVEVGIPLIQLREKHLSGKALFELAGQAVAITRETRTKLLINDRTDIAAAAGADGVHLTSTSLPADVIRRHFAANFIVGVSTHTLGEVVDAKRLGADFAMFGPIFITPGKGDPTGLDTLTGICLESGEFPVIALGGIDGTSYKAVLKAGGAGFAAIRWLNDPDELRSIAKDLSE